MRIHTLALVPCLLLGSQLAHAQQELTAAGQVSYDFADFTAAGFAPTAPLGGLDSDEWIAEGVLGLSLGFGDTSANEDFANGTSAGGEAAGGVWAFTPVPAQCGAGDVVMLGVQPSNMTFSPGSFQLRVQNSTGAPLTEVHLQYGLAWFNDAGRSSLHTLAVLQLDGDGAETGRVTVDALEALTPEDADGVPAWDGQCQTAAVDLSAIPIAAGDNFVIRFDIDDAAGSGTRDEIGIGEILISAPAFGDAGPTPAADAGPDTPDAGAPADVDAGDLSPDAGGGPSASDAGSGAGDEGNDAGCGCQSTGGSGAWGLALLGLVALRRRRR